VGPRAVPDTVVKRKIPSPRWESNPQTPVVQSLYRLTYPGKALIPHPICEIFSSGRHIPSPTMTHSAEND